MLNKQITNMLTGKSLSIRQGYEADSLEVEIFLYGSRGSMLGKIGLDQNDVRLLRAALNELEMQPAGCTCGSIRPRKHYPVCALWAETMMLNSATQTKAGGSAGSAEGGDEFLGSADSSIQG